MIMTYVKLVFAVAIMLAQPVQHDYDRGPVRNGVAMARSHDVSSIPAERSPETVAQGAMGIRGERSKPAAHARAAAGCEQRQRDQHPQHLHQGRTG